MAEVEKFELVAKETIALLSDLRDQISEAASGSGHEEAVRYATLYLRRVNLDLRMIMGPAPPQQSAQPVPPSRNLVFECSTCGLKVTK